MKYEQRLQQFNKLSIKSFAPNRIVSDLHRLTNGTYIRLEEGMKETL
jgi:hypothetical protein